MENESPQRGENPGLLLYRLRRAPPDSTERYREPCRVWRAPGNCAHQLPWISRAGAEKNPGSRIIFVGDSIVFNGGVPQEKTFNALLERKFSARGEDVEIINAGTADFGIDQYLLHVGSGRFWSLDPQVLVVGLYLNDSRPPQGFLGETEGKGWFLNLVENPLLRGFGTVRLARDAYILRQQKNGNILSRRFDWVPRYAGKKWIGELPEFRQTVIEARYDWGAAWEPSFDSVVFPALREIRDLASKNGTAVAVVVFPVSLQVYTEIEDPYVSLPQRKIVEFAGREGIPILDLLPSFRARKLEWPLPDQCHLSPTGNEIAADAMLPFFRQILEKRGKKF